MSTSTTSQPIQNEPKDYFKLHKKILKICGISFMPNENIRYRLYSIFILSTTLFLYPVLATIELFKHDFSISSGILIYQMGTIVGGIKAILMLINRMKIEKLLNKLEQEPFLPNLARGGKEEERLVQECIWKTNLQTNAYWIFSVGSISTFSLYALCTRIINDDYHKWELPYRPLTILNISYSPNYEITWLYQYVCLCVTAGVYVITDLIIAGSLAHISYQFKILQNFLRNIVEYSQGEMLKDVSNILQNETAAPEIVVNQSANLNIHWKYLQKSIKEAVQYHLAILDLAKELEEYFRYLLLTTFLGILLMLCFHIYLIAFQNSTRHIMEYINATLPLVMICYWGEELLFQSEGVGDAAFESDFVGSDIRFQKALVMIIRRSQVPAKLTAGKFADICLATCLWVWRKSYSVCMVLRHIIKK